MHQCSGNRAAIGCAVVYSARAGHVFSAGIKCQHCISRISIKILSLSSYISIYNIIVVMLYSMMIKL